METIAKVAGSDHDSDSDEWPLDGYRAPFDALPRLTQMRITEAQEEAQKQIEDVREQARKEVMAVQEEAEKQIAAAKEEIREDAYAKRFKRAYRPLVPGNSLPVATAFNATAEKPSVWRERLMHSLRKGYMRSSLAVDILTIDEEDHMLKGSYPYRGQITEEDFASTLEVLNLFHEDVLKALVKGEAQALEEAKGLLPDQSMADAFDGDAMVPPPKAKKQNALLYVDLLVGIETNATPSPADYTPVVELLEKYIDWMLARKGGRSVPRPHDEEMIGLQQDVVWWDEDGVAGYDAEYHGPRYNIPVEAGREWISSMRDLADDRFPYVMTHIGFTVDIVTTNFEDVYHGPDTQHGQLLSFIEAAFGYLDGSETSRFRSKRFIILDGLTPAQVIPAQRTLCRLTSSYVTMGGLNLELGGLSKMSLEASQPAEKGPRKLFRSK
ncbi:hypothetical protein Slin14017_G119560 [Septoria linicola]|nr:hypothetical protein Slin14017_G119560 [Septoria linicola]